jgi:anti-sigma B factor antagonist
MSPDPVPQGSTGSGTYRVELLGMPVSLHERTRQHHEALQRELDMIRAGAPADSVPARLVTLMEELAERYRGMNPHVVTELRAAAERGDEEVDLSVEVPDRAPVAVERIERLLTEADEYCRAGELVTIETPADVLAYRTWFLEEFRRQHAGEPPRRWTPALVGATAGTEPASPSGAGATAVVVPSGAIDLVSAGALREELLAAREAATAVELDLRDVDFIDSVGLSLLVSVHRRLESEEVPLRVIVPRRLASSFELTGLDQVLGVSYS